MAETSHSSWGDIVREAEESPRPVAPDHSPTPAAAVEIPAPVPITPISPVPTPAVPAAEFSYPTAQVTENPFTATAEAVAVPSAGPHTFGVPPTGYGPIPQTPGPSTATQAFRAALAAVVLAGVGFGGYWGYDTFTKKDHTQNEASSDSGSKPADSVDNSEAPAPSPAPAAPPPAGSSAPAPSGSPAPDEGLYLMLLRNKTDMTITNPDRLLTLGKEVCTYLSTQIGVPPAVVINVREMLIQEGVTSSDGLHITSSAITALCPQYKSKILPGR